MGGKPIIYAYDNHDKHTSYLALFPEILKNTVLFKKYSIV